MASGKRDCRNDACLRYTEIPGISGYGAARRTHHLDVASEAEDRELPGRGQRHAGRSTGRGAEGDGTPAAAEPELGRSRDEIGPTQTSGNRRPTQHPASW